MRVIYPGAGLASRQRLAFGLPSSRLGTLLRMRYTTRENRRRVPATVEGKLVT